MGVVASNLWNVCQTLSQFYPPKSKFTVDQIPDWTGRVVIVTGMLLSRLISFDQSANRLALLLQVVTPAWDMKLSRCGSDVPAADHAVLRLS